MHLIWQLLSGDPGAGATLGARPVPPGAAALVARGDLALPILGDAGGRRVVGARAHRRILAAGVAR